MYERVLIPLDGSETAEAILPFAERVAGPVDAEVILLAVVEPLTAVEAVATAGVVAPDTFRLREKEAREYLERVQRRMIAKGIRARAAVRLGSAAAEILAFAAESRADLIAMATHGRSGLGRVVFGSVAEAVLRAAPVPVLAIRSAAPAGGATETP